jgi:pimeloyl-ACP methyl ester carboxylesterase
MIGGDIDRPCPSFSSYALNIEELRDATLVIIPECGHMPQEEYPDITVRLIDAFIQNKLVTDMNEPKTADGLQKQAALG